MIGVVQYARMDTTAGNSTPQVFDKVPPADRFRVIHQEGPYSVLPASVGARSRTLSGEGRTEVQQPAFAPAQKLSGFMARIKEGMSPGILPTS